jgi:hypothetical protein
LKIKREFSPSNGEPKRIKGDLEGSKQENFGQKGF